MAGLDVMNPMVYAPNLLVPFRKSLIFAGLANKDYEGEIRMMGDSVKIRQIGAITVNDYSKFTNTGSTSTALTWQALSAAEQMLIIDKAKSFSFAVDEVDMVQNFPKVMSEGLAEAGYAIANQIDSDVAARIASQSGNIIAAATISAGSVLTLFSAIARKFDEANVPQGGRVVIVPPFIHQDLLEAIPGAISALAIPKTYDNGVLASGSVGQLYGMDIFMSNNYPTTSSTAIVTAFHRSAVTFAGQLSTIKRVEREDYFDQGIKGLYLYGVKVIRPSGVVTFAATEG